MRSISFLSILFLIASCNNSDEKIVLVTGKFANAPEAVVYLEMIGTNDQPQIVDSVKMKNGSFELKANTIEESLLQLRFPDSKSAPYVFLASDNNKIKMTGDWNDFSRLRFEGSPASERLRLFLDSLARSQQEIFTLEQSASTQADSAAKLKVAQAYQNKIAKTNQYIRSVAEKDQSPVVSLFAASLMSQSGKVEEIEVVMNGLQKRFPRHGWVTKVVEQFRTDLEQTKNAQSAASKIVPGAVAPDLTMPDQTGKPLSISSFLGKYVLVDFWASWCGPCRGENPNVVAAFEKYKSKNFTVLGVSLDKDKESWLAAIQEDKLTWPHMSDLKFWESAAVPTYGIKGIPFNVLLDPTGKIVAVGLRGAALDQKLAEVLK
jgi:peroxiredoxin